MVEGILGEKGDGEGWIRRVEKEREVNEIENNKVMREKIRKEREKNEKEGEEREREREGGWEVVIVIVGWEVKPSMHDH